MPMTKREKTMYGKRLLKLADYLAKLPKKLWKYQIIMESQSCGTVGCAIGHACSMPAFRRLGARFYVDDYGGGVEAKLPCGELATCLNGVGEYLFGLNLEEAEVLFANEFLLYFEENGKSVRGAVIRNIRKMAKNKYGVTA